jgi:hypothetical protein
MNKPSAFFRSTPPSLIYLGATLAAILLAGFMLASVVTLSTIMHGELYRAPLCFTSECTKSLLTTLDPALTIGKATVDITVAAATIGGIFVALLSYLSASNNAALTNHIEHLKVFVEYIEAEISKRERLARTQFDTLLLYGTIFSQSRSGRTAVSEEYRSFIIRLNELIAESNDRCTTGTPGGFSYNDHQRRIRDHLAVVGITIFTAPRNDYLEMESQLFSLIQRLNQSFCPPGLLPEIVGRKYF